MKIYACLFAILITGCQSTRPNVRETNKSIKTTKEQMMCPMQYEPVCATIELNGETMEDTFGNSCMMSNAVGKIVSFYNGECGSSAEF